ncbi:MAG: radical SAM protein [Syntrophotaleaceae bacterium]
MPVLLLHPPAVKPAGPPLGIAVLLGHLRSRGISVSAIDANLQACLYLLEPGRLANQAGPDPGTALARAIRHVPRALELLRSPAAAAAFARYQTAVGHLNTALGVYRGFQGEERLTLGDYSHSRLSAFSPEHLARLATGKESTLFSAYFHEKLLPDIADRNPRLIALSINYRHQVLPAFELAGLLRRRFPGALLVAGGGLLTSWKAVLLQRNLVLPPFDHIAFGPGESVLARLAMDGRRAEHFLESAAELVFQPDFSGLDPAEYLNPHPILPLTASRGCYWERCLFCPEAVAPTHPFAAAEPCAFPELIIGLAEQWRTGHFHLTDNALPIPHLRAMASRKEELKNFSWYGFVRFEPGLADPALAADLARAGCRMLQLGLESGSQEVLDRLGKGTRLETAAAVLHNLHGAGIATYVYIMLGTPEETEEDRRLTLAFLEKHAASIDFLNLAIMNLPKDSVLPGEGSLPDSKEDSLALYRPVDEEAVQRRAARRFLQRELLASPAIRAIVHRTPPLFTSNHAMFFGQKRG